MSGGYCTYRDRNDGNVTACRDDWEIVVVEEVVYSRAEPEVCGYLCDVRLPAPAFFVVCPGTVGRICRERLLAAGRSPSGTIPGSNQLHSLFTPGPPFIKSPPIL